MVLTNIGGKMFPTDIQPDEIYCVQDGWIDDHTPREITDPQQIQALLAALDVSQVSDIYKPSARQSIIDKVRAVYNSGKFRTK